jgi:hypothetical protein
MTFKKTRCVSTLLAMFITLLMAVATGDAQTMRLADSPTAGGDQAYPKLIYYNRLPKGRHFAAWEQAGIVRHRAARGIPIAAHGELRGDS